MTLKPEKCGNIPCVSAASRIIALKDHPVLAEDAFSAELIHDAGKLILSSYVNERKNIFLMLRKSGSVSALSAEAKILGFDHAEIVSDVCEKWQISKHISTAIRCHHYPEKSNGNGLTYILHVEDAVAMLSVIGGGVDGRRNEIDVASLDFLNIDVGYTEEIMEQVVDYVEKTTSGLVSFKLRPPFFYDLLTSYYGFFKVKLQFIKFRIELIY